MESDNCLMLQAQREQIRWTSVNTTAIMELFIVVKN